MYARLVEGRTTPDRRAELDRIVSDELVPALHEQPGFAGTLNLFDRKSGDAILIVLWETADQARRTPRRYARSFRGLSRAAASALRSGRSTAGSDPGWQSSFMTTMKDLDELALSLPQTTRDVSADGRPSYLAHGKLFCCHRGRRRDAIDDQTGERLDDVLMFRVADLGMKELLLADDRGVFFTTPHFDGYAAVLMRIPQLARIDRDELHDLVVEAWLTRAQKRVARAWLHEHAAPDD